MIDLCKNPVFPAWYDADFRRFKYALDDCILYGLTERRTCTYLWAFHDSPKRYAEPDHEAGKYVPVPQISYYLQCFSLTLLANRRPSETDKLRGILGLLEP